MFRPLAAAFTALLLTQPAVAQDVTVYGGLELEFAFDEDDKAQSLIGYAEVEASGFYAGIEATIADDKLLNEVDLYLGYRSSVGALSYDVNYTRYFYPDDGGDCCGELFLGLGYEFTPQFVLGTELYFDPENDTGSAYLLADYALTDRFALAGQFGFYDEGAGNYTEWEAGIAYSLTDETAISFTYYEGEEYDPYVTLNFTWDFTLFSR